MADRAPSVLAEGTEAIARAFVAARKAGTGLPDYPGEVPESLDQAYRIQARAIELFGGTIAGWKIGRINPPLDERHGANRLVGPIFAASVVEAKGGAPEMPVFGQGFAAAEAEFLLRIGRLPDLSRCRWSNVEAAAHIDRIRVGIEVASSPFPGINALGPAVTVSDFGNNKGLVLGDEIAADSGFLGWMVSLTIDGEEAGRGIAADMLDGPFGSARFLFELAAARGLPLAAGQWISTGAVTGVHPVRPGAAIEARFGEGLEVACSIGDCTP